MSLKGIGLRVLSRAEFLRGIVESLCRRLIINPRSRQRLNKFYNRLSSDEKAVFQSLTAKAFINNEPRFEDAEWNCSFLKASIRMPLRPAKMWLDWDNAVSIAGHDYDVKSLYAMLLESSRQPRVFFDVGANYGTHSLLFLKSGVQTITFEPNPNCVQEFRNLCRINEIDPNIQMVAVGDQDSQARFWFPERETWLGTIVDSTKGLLSKEHDLQEIVVRVVTLDSFAKENAIAPDLIKIDTEGNEVNVLKGATETIRRCKPLIVFEANLLSDRSVLWTELCALDYRICALPVETLRGNISLTRDQFVEHRGFNFVAVNDADPLVAQQI
jgi:FkbM family methyltransferase